MNDTPAKFKELFEATYNELCNYAYTFLKSSSQSEDLVQETFIKLWQKRPDLIANETVKSYLYTAVRNNCITRLRKKSPEILSDEVLRDMAPPENEEIPEQEDMSAYYQHLIQEAVALLPPKCKMIFIHCKMDKMTYQQVADKLNLSVKTVENQMGIALKKLRDHLGKYNLR